MKKLIVSIPLIAALAYTGIASATSKKWKEYRSDHFTIYSDLSEKKAKSKVIRFEIYRKALGLFLSFDDSTTEADHDILIFKNSQDYRAIAPKGSAGVYIKNRPTPTMLMVGRHRDKEFNEAILYHEYIHHLMLTNDSRFYPHWYREGVAELLSYTQIGNDKVSLGLSSAQRMYYLREPRQLSVKDLLEPDYSLKSVSNPYWGKFYARAWLLAHYIQFGSFAGMPDRSAGLSTYLSAYQRGENQIADFEKAFGISTQQLDKELKQYLKLAELPGISFKVGEYKGKLSVKKISPPEANFLYADVAYHMGKEDLALRYFEKSDELLPKDDMLKKVNTAILLNHQDHKDSEAKKLISDILDEGFSSLDSTIQAKILHYFSDVLTQNDKLEKPDNPLLVAEIESLAEQSIQQYPLESQAYRWLDTLYRSQSNTELGFKNRLAWHKVDPQNVYNRWAIAADFYERGNAVEALQHIQYALSWLHDDNDIAKARKLETKIKEALSKN